LDEEQWVMHQGLQMRKEGQREIDLPAAPQFNSIEGFKNN